MRNSNTFSVRIAYIIHGIFSKINLFLSTLPKFVSCYETSAPQLCTFTPYLRILCHRPLRKLRVRQVSTGTKFPEQPRSMLFRGGKRIYNVLYNSNNCAPIRGNARSSAVWRAVAAVSGSLCCKSACKRVGRSCVVRQVWTFTLSRSQPR